MELHRKGVQIGILDSFACIVVGIDKTERAGAANRIGKHLITVILTGNINSSRPQFFDRLIGTAVPVFIFFVLPPIARANS